uniref:Uncharacterized protein n=1 Tax=Chromera velia CCMP2878 TaxID=1169474 RepID=A0A0G4I071_9ALVE|eukprot:Cvel_34216.t1-p1 / transcript=Cvel_34216.t1 / gene=Cvel_34216 / organism=Chromera_velia_CCMP2878 / gene_product=hypothetical protein / transcript_product=hypothetical protein / location=Cvel_scaffold5800:318-914(-) / protein_length=173 / sequence_SO=supercontig / SO=protein_coding / is_pseudo=false
MEFPDEQPQFNPLRNRGSDRAAPTPLSIGRGERGGGGGGGGQSPVVPSDAVPQLITRLQQEIAEANPSNAIYFTVDFLCQNYPEHLEGFADIFHGAPDLEEERTQVAHFFALHKIGLARSSEFCKAGYDTLDSLMLLSADDLNQIETANGVEWPPGHKIRLQQGFGGCVVSLC